MEVLKRHMSAFNVLKADKYGVTQEAKPKEDIGNLVKGSLLKKDITLVTERASKVKGYCQSKEKIHKSSSR
jgi:hypothetical protein